MFIDTRHNLPFQFRSKERNVTGPVLFRIPSAPSNGIAEKVASRCYKHLTPNGVTKALCQNTLGTGH
jgi:hypothetical protein